MSLSAGQRQRARRIADELFGIARSDEALPGTIDESLASRPVRLPCMADPPKAHGPYLHRTRKTQKRTAGRRLSADQADDYPWP